nr:MAG TPA: hypothetical protein [Caudoviricetes sp.]
MFENSKRLQLEAKSHQLKRNMRIIKKLPRLEPEQ